MKVLVKGIVGGFGFMFSFALLAIIIALWPWGWSPSWRSFVPWSSPPTGLSAERASEAEHWHGKVTVLKDALTDTEGPQEKTAVIERFTKSNGTMFTSGEPPKPWRLYSQTRQGKMAYASMGGLSGLPHGAYTSLAECQQALHAQSEPRITQLRQLAATQRGLAVRVVDKSNYVSVEQSRGAGYKSVEESVCHLQEAPPT